MTFPPAPSPTLPGVTKREQSKRTPKHDAWAERPWQLTKFLWNLLPSALLPALLISTIDAIARYVAHLRQQKARNRVRKLDAFREAVAFG